MESKLVSVVIPTRNRPILLAQTLATILNQTHKKIEVIVSDDGSSGFDMMAVAGMQDKRVKWLRSNVGTGVANARNRGIIESTGDYVAFCDDDDLWVADKLERQLNAMKSTGHHWSYAPTLNITSERKPWALYFGPTNWDSKAIYVTNVIPGGGSSVIASRNALNTAGRFDERLSQFADWELWMRLSKISPPASSNEIGVLYRIHQSQMSSNFAPMTAELAIVREIHAANSSNNSTGIDFGDSFIVHQMRRAGEWWQAMMHIWNNANPPYHRSAIKIATITSLYCLGIRRKPLNDQRLQKIIDDLHPI